MDQQSELKLKGIVYGSRTNWLGRAIHFIGDTIVMSFPVRFLSAILYQTTEIKFFTSNLSVIIMLVAYYATMESLFQKTIFKIFTGSIVVTPEGKKPKPVTILLRSLIRFIPFEPISLLFTSENERWWHDTWTKTYVVKASKLKESLQKDNDQEKSHTEN
jgi:uncharacterized RDD family membrane protein YckC